MSSWFCNGNVYIKKKSFPEILVFIVLVFPFFESFLTEFLLLPRATRYIVDMVIVVLLITLFWKGKLVIISDVLPLLVLVGLFFLYVVVGYIFNFQSLFYFLWGLRNYFRFYIAFFTFIMAVKEGDAYSLLKLFDCLFWINAIISLFQFFVMNIQQDFLGGLFGAAGGTNGYTLIFFTIVICKSLLLTFDGTEKPIYCISKCVTSLLIAAMAEMKFYFFVFITILVLTSVLTRFSKSKLLIVFVSVLAVYSGSILLSYIFGSFEDFLSLEKLLAFATQEHYSSKEDLNRLSAIPTLMKNYVTDPVQQLFGLGLGNCDTSNIAILNSPFYQEYSYLHYTWFASAMLFLETGFVGLILYISFFVICMVYSIRQLKRGMGNRLFCQMGIIMSLLCMILMIYNASLRIEGAYMVYFVLALPFLSSKKRMDHAEKESSVEK